MKRIILAVVLMCAAFSVHAQHSLQIDNGTNVFLITAPVGPGGTYILPAGGGTLITTGTGSTSPWLLQGNSLSGAGGSPTQWFGTSSNDDVVMMANNVEKMRLVSGGNIRMNDNVVILNNNGLALREASANGNNYVALVARSNMTAGNVILTLPNDDGAAGEVLTTDGTGNLSWTTPSSLGWLLGGNNTASTVIGNTSATGDIDITAGNVILMHLEGNAGSPTGHIVQFTRNESASVAGGRIGLPYNTRRGLVASYDETIGDAYGLDQVGSDVTGDVPSTRIYTATLAGPPNQGKIEFGRYTSLTAFTTYATFSGTNGNLDLNANLNVDGTTDLNLGAGIVHSAASGLLSSSLIVNADVHSTAGIQFSKMESAGAAGGDLSGTYPNPTVVAVGNGAVDLTTDVTGILPVANGGTGVNATTVAAGQILIGHSTNNNFSLATLTAGTDITINNTDGGITINSTAVSNGQIFAGCTEGNSNNTNFASLNGQPDKANEDHGSMLVPRAGTFRNFYVRLSAAPGVGSSKTATLRVNGVNTAITVTISGAAQTGNDLVNSVAVSAGDQISLQFTHTSGPAGSAIQWAIEFD